MAASGKKSGAKAKTKTRSTPIEGEVLSSGDSPGDSPEASPKTDGVDTFRRFVWFVTGAAIVFIAGLIAAPTIQRSIDSFLGNDAPTPVSAETVQAEPPEADVVATEVVPEETPEQVEPESAQEAMEATRETEEEIAVPTAERAPEPEAASPITSDISSDISDEKIMELTELVAALEARLAILEARPAQEPLNRNDNAAAERIALLEARLAQIESSERAIVSAVTSGNDGLLLALARLSRRLESGQSFSAEMLEFSTRFGALSAPASAGNEVYVDTLAAHASAGVKTPAMLRRVFAAVLPAALEAAALPEDAGWWDKVWASLKSLVVVRRTGEVEGADAGALLARIEFHLTEADIGAALAEAAKLEPRVLAALDPWPKDAGDSLAARRATEALIESFSAPSGDKE